MTSFFGELRRRNVVKVAVAYAIVGWLLVQVADTFFPALQLPEWTVTLVAGLVILGFPLALILSWAYELTPEGVQRSHEVAATESNTHVTGRKLDFTIIGVLAVAVGVFAVDRFVFVDESAQSVSAVDRRSIAALPFSNDSAAAENAEFFADGIHDELLTRLANIRSLKVISRTSVMEYRDRTQNIREIGRELGVATILEGRVQRVGDMVRINVQLIDAETDEHLWANIYNREITAANIFAIQSEMATSIADALQATLLPEEVARLNDVPTESTRAYDFYLSGNDYFNRPDDRTFKPLAVQQYQRAVAEDPGFALAWAALSRSHSLMHWYAVDRTEARLEMALEAVELAFEYAPNLPEAHLALGQYYYQGFRDYEKALTEFGIAEQNMLGVGTVFELRAYVQRRMGEVELSVISMSQAIERDPRNTDLLFQQAGSYLQLRSYEQAKLQLERALEIEPDNAAVYVLNARRPLFRDGDVTPAKAAAANPPFDLGSWRHYLGWMSALYERDYGTALAYLDDLEGEAIEDNDNYFPKAGYYGVTYSLAGQPEVAIDHFNAARTHVEEALESAPDDARLYVALAEAMVGLGETERAVELADRAKELMPKSRDADSGARIQLDVVMRVYGPAGATDAAIRELDDYLSAPGLWSIEGLLPDPRLDPIRNDARFQALIEEYGRQ